MCLQGAQETLWEDSQGRTHSVPPGGRTLLQLSYCKLLLCNEVLGPQLWICILELDNVRLIVRINGFFLGGAALQENVIVNCALRIMQVPDTDHKGYLLSFLLIVK